MALDIGNDSDRSSVLSAPTVEEGGVIHAGERNNESASVGAGTKTAASTTTHSSPKLPDQKQKSLAAVADSNAAAASPPPPDPLTRLAAAHEAMLAEMQSTRVCYQQLVQRLDALEGREQVRRKLQAEAAQSLRKCRERTAQSVAEKLSSALYNADGWEEFTPQTGDKFDGELHIDSQKRQSTPDATLEGKVAKALSVGFIRMNDGIGMVKAEVTRFKLRN